MVSSYSCFCENLSTDFFKNFLKKFFQGDKHSDGPDLGPNCLQKFLADDKSSGEQNY